MVNQLIAEESYSRFRKDLMTKQQSQVMTKVTNISFDRIDFAIDMVMYYQPQKDQVNFQPSNEEETKMLAIYKEKVKEHRWQLIPPIKDPIKSLA